MDPDWVPSVLIHKKAIPPLKLQTTASAEKKKKSEILPDYMPLDLRRLKLKNPVMLMRQI